MVTLDEARKIMSAAESKAKELHQPMNIAVVDVSAIGVSGGSGEQDQAVAEAGRLAFE